MPDTFNAPRATLTMVDETLVSTRRVPAFVKAMGDRMLSLITDQYLSPGRPVFVGLADAAGQPTSRGATVRTCVPCNGRPGYQLALELHDHVGG